jgi:hypothetical protein
MIPCIPAHQQQRAETGGNPKKGRVTQTNSDIFCCEISFFAGFDPPAEFLVGYSLFPGVIFSGFIDIRNFPFFLL